MFLQILLSTSFLALGSATIIEDVVVPPVTVRPEPRQSACTFQYKFPTGLAAAAFRSPGYPNSYSLNQNCQWEITADPGVRFNMTCPEFNVVNSATCEDGIVFHKDGDRSTGLLACGYLPGLNLQSTSNLLYISFFSGFRRPLSGGPFRFDCVIQTVLNAISGGSSSSTGGSSSSTGGSSSSGTAVSSPAPQTPTSTPSTSTSASASCSCGTRNEAMRIVGGTNAVANEFPWRVALYNENAGAFCGGTIISENYVMTAAHCCKALSSTDQLYVDVGDHDLTSNTESTNHLVLVDKQTIHPGYNTTTQDQDICMLHLSKPLTFSRNVQPACLPWNMTNQTFQNKTVTASGWGTISSGGAQSTTMKKVDLPVLTTEECKKYYGSSITSNMLCTYSPGKDTCQGDSGGSIDYKDPANSKYYAIGVVSWGVGCAGTNQPGVYVKVTKYLDWITSTATGEKFCKA